MNDPISKTNAGQPNALRRKIAKAGLAAPVVLATLASKPVLAGGKVTYNCTISGQLSGNASGKGGATCNTLGRGKADWVASYSSTSKTNPCTSTKISDVFPALTTPYIYWDGSNLTFTHTSHVASIYKILTIPAPNSQIEYAQKALVLLLNANGNADPTLYPLTQSQGERLFVAAATQQPFTDTNPTVNWPYSPDVTHFIDLLWH